MFVMLSCSLTISLVDVSMAYTKPPVLIIYQLGNVLWNIKTELLSFVIIFFATEIKIIESLVDLNVILKT